MGIVLMSKRELNRLDVLARLDSDRLTVLAAAGLMNVTPRQTYRLLSRYREGGASAIANQRRGRPSNNRLSDEVRDHAIALVRQLYADFGPTLAAEKLEERHDLKVSRETLRNWMRQRRDLGLAGRAQADSSSLGTAASMSASWSRSTARTIAGSRNARPACTLLVFVDDATSRLMELRFVASESTFAYFAGAEGLSRPTRQAGRLLLRQAFHLPRVERERGRPATE
jgi:transposase-like protein